MRDYCADMRFVLGYIDEVSAADNFLRRRAQAGIANP